jgi:outer membrane protein assembly factor BamB
MRSRLAKTTLVLGLALIVVAVWHVAAQPQIGPPQGGFPGGPMPMMGPMGPPPAPVPVVVVGDGVVYVACDGKLTAFEAKTLKKLGEATYWERPEPPKRPNP